MILIDSTELMVPGDIFQMYWADWYRIIYPPLGISARIKDKRKIDCRVKKVFVRSSVEIRYVCVSTEDPHQTEFVLGQILDSTCYPHTRDTEVKTVLQYSQYLDIDKLRQIGKQFDIE